jgi:hypothetical protein
MKSFKKLSLLFIVALISMNTSIAQGRQQERPQGGPPPIPNDEQIAEMVTDLSRQLSLSDAQEDEVSEIYSEHFIEVRVLQEENKGTSESNRKIMENLNTKLENSVKALLTDDQKKIYESYLKEQKSKRKQQGGPPQGKK